MVSKFTGRRFVVAKFAILCALVGPALGLLMLMIGVFILRLVNFGGLPREWDFGNLVWVLFFYPFALIYAGPGGVVLGALATWLLIRKHETGAARRILRTLGAVYGFVFGGLVLPFSFLLTSPLLHGFSSLHDLRFIDWLLFVFLGSLIGMILGLTIATRLARPPAPGLP